MNTNTNEPIIDVSYRKLVSYFKAVERSGTGKHLKGYIIFTADSFDAPYTEYERTYCVTSYNKAFQPNMGGYSIYGTSLDGTDRGVRLERYMMEERGGKDGWKIERCYLKKEDFDNVKDIIRDKKAKER